MNNRKTLMTPSLKYYHYFLFLIAVSLVISSCGYDLIGSKPLPFKSVAIKPVINKTYEPGLEERLHNALSREFIAQGIKVKAVNGDIDLTATITDFELGALAYTDEIVQEQDITLKVDVIILDKNQVMEFRSMQSPIRITYRSTGTVNESVVQKEKAIDKSCSEIAREIISKIIIKYAE
jgi:outer membrane lipopolysaccharide assembly protein LptE/RlpB